MGLVSTNKELFEVKRLLQKAYETIEEKDKVIKKLMEDLKCQEEENQKH